MRAADFGGQDCFEMMRALEESSRYDPYCFPGNPRLRKRLGAWSNSKVKRVLRRLQDEVKSIQVVLVPKVAQLRGGRLGIYLLRRLDPDLPVEKDPLSPEAVARLWKARGLAGEPPREVTAAERARQSEWARRATPARKAKANTVSTEGERVMGDPPTGEPGERVAGDPPTDGGRERVMGDPQVRVTGDPPNYDTGSNYDTSTTSTPGRSGPARTSGCALVPDDPDPRAQQYEFYHFEPVESRDPTDVEVAFLREYVELVDADVRRQGIRLDDEDDLEQAEEDVGAWIWNEEDPDVDKDLDLEVNVVVVVGEEIEPEGGLTGGEDLDLGPIPNPSRRPSRRWARGADDSPGRPGQKKPARRGRLRIVGVEELDEGVVDAEGVDLGREEQASTGASDASNREQPPIFDPSKSSFSSPGAPGAAPRDEDGQGGRLEPRHGVDGATDGQDAGRVAAASPIAEEPIEVGYVPPPVGAETEFRHVLERAEVVFDRWVAAELRRRGDEIAECIDGRYDLLLLAVAGAEARGSYPARAPMLVVPQLVRDARLYHEGEMPITESMWAILREPPRPLPDLVKTLEPRRAARRPPAATA